MLHYIDRLELPQWYDENIMNMLAVKPTTAFLYWELAFGQWKALQQCILVLNLYEVPSSLDEECEPRLIRSLQLPPYTENWYFNDLQPARRYQAEIARKENERFYSIIKSNIVCVPPATPLATLQETKWRPIADQIVAAAGPARQPIKETVQELTDSMSFYMGINKAS
jgi:hypothetical protein